jgi:hypothetical protein
VKPRLHRLVPVDKPGHLVVELPGKGPHHLRLPTWSAATRLAKYSVDRPDDGRWEYFALLIGAAWRHEAQEIEAQLPATDEDLPAYGEAVQIELEEAGYTARDVAVLAVAVLDGCTARMHRRKQEAAEAVDLADFSGPPTATTSSP